MPRPVDRREIHVAARGKDGQPWAAYFDGTRWWGGRTLSGMVMRGHPALAVVPKQGRSPNQALYLFVWAHDGSLQYTSQMLHPIDPQSVRWAPWRALGSLEYTSSPASTLLRDGDQHELVVVIRDDSNRLRAFIRDHTGHWRASMGGDDVGKALRSGPSIGIMNEAGQKSLHVFARRDDGGGLTTCTRQVGGTWSSWVNVA